MQKRNGFLGIALFLALAQSPLALASVEFYDAVTQQKITDGSYSGEERFVETSYGVRVFGLVITPKNPEYLKKNWTLQGGEVFQVGAAKNLVVGSPEAFLLNESKSPVVRIVWNPENKGVLYDRCQLDIFSAKMAQVSTSGSIKPSSTESKLPFPVGVSCNMDVNPPRLMVAVPANVDWAQHALKEVAGKGERWRVFELPSGNTKNDQVGHVAFLSQQKFWKISLHIKTLVPEVGPGRSLGFDKSVGLGMATAGLTAGGQSFSSTDTIVRFEGLTEPLLKIIRLGVNLKFNLGLSSNPGLIYSKDVGLNAGLYSGDADGEKKKLFYGIFGEYHSIDYKHQTTNFSLQAIAFTGGAVAQWAITPKHRVRAVGRYGAFGSSVITSNMTFLGGYQAAVKIMGVNTWLGATYVNQNMKAKNSQGDARGLTEGQYLLTLDF